MYSWLSLRTSELELGLPLRYDVFSSEGDHIGNAGDEFTASIRASWIQLGFDKVLARAQNVESNLDPLRPYDQSVIQTIESNLQLANEVICTIAGAVGQKHAITSMEFDELCRDFVSNIQQDSAAALSVLAESIFATSHDQANQIAERSSQLALLAMAIANQLGLVPLECQTVGTVAMLHDISLMAKCDSDLDEYYLQHPLISTQIADTIVGMSTKATMAIAQVHETPSGDGFPRGLKLGRIQRAARIVNLADVYLTLTRASQPSTMPVARNFHPTDAIGYLMHHASRGQFEIPIVQALINATSLYPIGSKVILSDQSSATVFRSIRAEKTKPIVRFDDRERPIDLRHSSLTITGPDRNLHQLLKKSQLEERFWI